MIVVSNASPLIALSRVGLFFVGTAGILVLAKEEGLIESVRKNLIKVIKEGFKIKKSVCERILREAGE